MNFVLPVLLFACGTLILALVWWLMARRPEQWARWVERENNFWRDRGWISPATAEKMKRWETGAALKLFAAGTAIIGAVGLALTLAVLLQAASIEHQKIRMPYNPALQPKKVRH